MPEQQKIRGAYGIICKKAAHPRKDEDAQRRAALMRDEARNERGGNEAEQIPEGELHDVTDPAAARKYGKPQKPHQYVHAHGRRAVSGPQQQPCQYGDDRLKRERHEGKGNLNICRNDH